MFEYIFVENSVNINISNYVRWVVILDRVTIYLGLIVYIYIYMYGSILSYTLCNFLLLYHFIIFLLSEYFEKSTVGITLSCYTLIVCNISK
jgi:hypothetical protein